jgi:hypothetical protein
MSLFMRSKVRWNTNHRHVLSVDTGNALWCVHLQRSVSKCSSCGAFDLSVMTSGLDSSTQQSLSLSSDVSQHRQYSLWQFDASVLVSHGTAQPMAAYPKTICIVADSSFASGSDTITWQNVPGILKGRGILIFRHLSSPIVVLDPP